jgi:hypothetical protein
MTRFVAMALVAIVLGASAGTALADDAAIDRLIAAYPDFLAKREGNHLSWRDGTLMTIDDGKGEKDFETRLNGADIEDQFSVPYVPGKPAAEPGINQDPGRIRNDPMFRKMYGDCRKGGVAKDLVPVVWLPKHKGGRVMMTGINGAARQLQAVSDELDALPDAMMAYLTPTAGTYNCRVIAGTDRTSMHAYGVAIDINTSHAHYWRNGGAVTGGRVVYRNQIPFEIVEIFERHGFIWGGKWYHYDTMQFEYRPELIAPVALDQP